MEFRRSLAASFLFRFFVEVSYALEHDAPSFKAAAALPPEYESAVRKFERPAPRGMQYFTKVEDGQVVGQPERHLAADLQARRCINQARRPASSQIASIAYTIVAMGLSSSNRISEESELKPKQSIVNSPGVSFAIAAVSYLNCLVRKLLALSLIAVW